MPGILHTSQLDHPLDQLTIPHHRGMTILIKPGVLISILRKEWVPYLSSILYSNNCVQYDPASYPQPYIPEGGPSSEPSPPATESTDPPRGRKRTRTQVNPDDSFPLLLLINT